MTQSPKSPTVDAVGHPITGYPPNTKELTPKETKTLHLAIGGSALGNAVEWFDYAVYGYLAVYIAANFFPSEDGGASLLSTFAVLAASFIIRPIGGIVLGPLGDRIGRQKVLVLTVTMMSLATAAIGILPTFDSIGIFAPILLLVCRLVQGFSTGGEYGGAAVFMAEYAPDKRRGFFGSFLEFGTLAGTVAGATLCTLLNLGLGDDTMEAWGWRIPFLLTLPLGMVALWLRTRLEDSPVFAEAKADGETISEGSQGGAIASLKSTMTYWQRILILMGFVLLLNIAYYTVLTFLPSYLSDTLGHSTTQSNFTLVVIMLILMAIINPIGALSDRVGRKPLLLTACVGYFVFSVPLFLLIINTGIVGQTVGLLGLGILLVIMLSCVSSTLPALFPTQVRYGAFAIGYNVSTSLFGGTAPLILTFLIDRTGSNLIPGWYMMLAAASAFVPILLMPETAGRSLRGNQCPGDNDAELAAQGIELVGYKSR
ncbi:MFS transporter [Rhodococcus sp. H29-C3]|uniref:MFS transporter n=1 Tax=Rhodococcus sp. H29-C3 TaxID=3046307 RepID=UPI0032D57A22